MTYQVTISKPCLKFWVNERGTTQRKVAVAVGISEAMMSMAACGIVRLPYKTVEKIAAFLGITVAHLESGSGPRRIAEALTGGAA